MFSGEVVDALEEAMEFGLHFLDKRTGEIVTLSDEEWEAGRSRRTHIDVSRVAARDDSKSERDTKSENFVELPDRAEIKAAISDPRHLRAEQLEALAVDWLDYEGILYTREIT